MKSILTFPIFCTVFAVGMVITSHVHGQAIADFSRGEGTVRASTQFVGATGDGWLTPWNIFSENTKLTTTVERSNPIFGPNNYLQVRIEAGAKAQRRTAVSRSFETALAENAHTIAFSIRPDDLTGWGSNDFFGIFATNNPLTTTTSTDAQTWGILILGSSNTISFRDGEDSSIQTGIPFTEGVTYSFVLNIDPVNNSWVGSVSTSENESFTSGYMEYRRDNTVGRTVNINTLMDSNQATSNDNWTYSLDGLSIIP